MLIHPVVFDALRPRGWQPTRLLCPWDFSGKNTGLGCHFLLRGILWTQGSNLHLLHCRWILKPSKNKLWYLRTMEWHSSGQCLHHQYIQQCGSQNTMQRERTLTYRSTCCAVLFTWRSRTSKLTCREPRYSSAPRLSPWQLTAPGKCSAWLPSTPYVSLLSS